MVAAVVAEISIGTRVIGTIAPQAPVHMRSATATVATGRGRSAISPAVTRRRPAIPARRRTPPARRGRPPLCQLNGRALRVPFRHAQAELRHVQSDRGNGRRQVPRAFVLGDGRAGSATHEEGRDDRERSDQSSQFTHLHAFLHLDCWMRRAKIVLAPAADPGGNCTHAGIGGSGGACNMSTSHRSVIGSGLRPRSKVSADETSTSHPGVNAERRSLQVAPTLRAAS